jgi:hypothetical protein
VSTYFFIKLGLLAFWGLWYLIAFSTNLCESFKTLGVLRNTWPFASENLRAVTEAIKIYSASRWLPRVLFSGVLFAQLLAGFLFGWATISSFAAGYLNSAAINAAFAAGLGLWAAFMLVDEILKQYDTEHTHALFFIAQLVTFVALVALPL